MKALLTDDIVRDHSANAGVKDMRNLKSSHASGDLREAFHDAMDAYSSWEYGTPEPVISVEVGSATMELSIRTVCGLLRDCTDIVPGDYADCLEKARPQPRSRTYGEFAYRLAKEVSRRLSLRKEDA